MTTTQPKRNPLALRVTAWVLLGVAVILLIVTVVSYAHEGRTRTMADLGLPLATTVAALAAIWTGFWTRLWNAPTTGLRARNIVLAVIITFILVTIGATEIENLATWIAGIV